jgi:tight adherence protein B
VGSTARLLDGRAAGLAVGLIAGAVCFAVGGLLVAVAGVLASVATVRAFSARRAQQQATERRAVTEGLLEALSAELASGAAPADAVAAVLHDLPQPVRDEVVPVQRALRSGGDVGPAWRTARSLTHVDALVAAFRVCEDSGASLASVLARLTAMVGDERRRRDEIGLALAGPRSSAALLAALPALGILAGAGLGASPLPFLLRTSFGHVCFFLGVGLDVLGARWVARLAASAGRQPRLQ